MPALDRRCSIRRPDLEEMIMGGENRDVDHFVLAEAATATDQLIMRFEPAAGGAVLEV